MTSDPVEVTDDSKTVTVRKDEYGKGVITIEISRPENRNALNDQVRSELRTAVTAVDDSDARAVVLTGDGSGGAFVAGADIQDFRNRNVNEQRRAGDSPRVYEAIADLNQPAIARINGHALGGGCELTLACDIRIAVRDAKIGLPEITLGLMPGGGATQRLPRIVGDGKARELIFTGEPITTTEAARIGLVNDVVPADELDDRVADVAGTMAEHSAIALRFAKRACNVAYSTPLDEGVEHERELFHGLFATGEKNEGIDAFFEDRDPEWEW